MLARRVESKGDRRVVGFEETLVVARFYLGLRSETTLSQPSDSASCSGVFP